MRAGPGIATVKDHYAILGVARDAPIEVIRAAYRVLVQKYHPDRNRDPEAGGRAEEINTAYAVLKDPGARARYDQELPRAAGEAPVYTGDCPPASTVLRSVGSTTYELLFEDGVVRENAEWVYYSQKVKYDGRPFIGAGRYLATEGIPKQRVWLQMPRGDQFVDRSGELLPVTSGQPITLVSLHHPGSRASTVAVAIVNRATGQWFELANLFQLANGLLTGSQRLRQGIRVFAVLLGALGVFYGLAQRHTGLVGWLFALLVGVPVIGSIVLVFAHREANRVERDIRDGLASAGLQ